MLANRTHTVFPSGGYVLLEVLITVVVLAVGLLGLAKLQASTRQFDVESYQRAQAVILMRDMIDRMTANRYAIGCYAFTNITQGGPYLGTGATFTPNCATAIGPAAQQAAEMQTAIDDMNAWNDALQGAAETAGGKNAGAMIGARGCVGYDATNNIYIVAVSWQGLLDTGSSPVALLQCGKATSNYNPDSTRRTISETFVFGKLN
jgi:type IV pilus assembly protein PilV